MMYIDGYMMYIRHMDEINVWIDDLRTPPESWVWCKTSGQAISFLKVCVNFGLPVQCVSFDHDLGGDDTTRPVILWMCENDWWPADARAHTANPVGREWIEGMVQRYGPGITR